MLNKILLKDFYYISNFKQASFNLICIDPPYEINYQNITWDKMSLNWSYLIDEFFRLLKLNGNLIIFQGWSNVTNLIKLIESSKNKFYFQNWIIWDRIKGRGAKYNFTSTREDILWFTKQEKNYIFNKIYSNIPKKTKGLGLKNKQPNRSLSNIWTDISPIVPWSNEKVNHPTQKPLKLLERIITIFSNKDNLVLDCFCGSGTTGVACKNLNRNFILLDNKEEYINITKERIYGKI